MSIKFLLKKQTFFIVFLFVLVNTISVQAAVVYTNYSIPYTVTVPTNQAPVVDAGPDKAIMLPSTSTSATGTASDPDGTLSTTIWTFVSGPVAATIGTQNNTSPSTVTFSGMTVAGTYVFRFNAEDNLGLWGWDEMQVVVSDATPSPSGTLSVPSCSIALGGSSCASTISWTTSNLTANPTSITRDTGSPASFTLTAGQLPNSSQGTTLSYGTTVFSLIHNGSTLAMASPIADCASGSWNGSACEEAGSPECSDGMDNDDPEDDLEDSKDPGCHTDGDASNDSSYDPNDNNETNVSECSDGVDNNDPEDVVADDRDPGCYTGDPQSIFGSVYDPNDNDETDQGGGGGGNPECSDGVDNDSDGFIDYPNDPGCSSAADTSEVDRRKPIFIEF